MKSDKTLSLKPHIIAFLLIILLLPFILTQYSYSEEQSCGLWMGKDFNLSEHKTESQIIEGCDDKTFKVLNHEYAKDKKFVYFKPMPNASNLTVILKEADAKSFKLLKRCTGYAIDKKHVYLSDKIVKDKDPQIFKKYDPKNPKTFCH